MAQRRQSKGRSRVRPANRRQARKSALVLERRNYALIAMGVAMIVVGFVIMRLDNQVESFVSLYAAPLIIIAGYVGVGYGIMWKPRRTEAERE